MSVGLKKVVKLIKNISKDKSFKVIGIESYKSEETFSHFIHHCLSENGFNTLLISDFSIYYKNQFIIDTYNYSEKEYLSNLRLILFEDIDFIIWNTNQYIKDIQNYQFIDELIFINNNNRENFTQEYLLKWVNIIKDKGFLNSPSSFLKLFQELNNISHKIKHDIVIKKYKEQPKLNDEVIYSINKVIPNINLYIQQLASTIVPYIGIQKFLDSIKSFNRPLGLGDIIRKEPFYIVINKEYNNLNLVEFYSELKKIKNKNSKIITITSIDTADKDVANRFGYTIGKLTDYLVLSPVNCRNNKSININNLIIGGIDLDLNIVERFDSKEKYLNSNKLDIKNTSYKAFKDDTLPVIIFDENSYQARLDSFDLVINNIAQINDIVVILGKGRENFIIFDNIEYEWSDFLALDEINLQNQ